MSGEEVHALDPGAVHGTSLFVTGAEARHISRVLRHRVGDELRFATGTGEFLVAKVDRIESDGISAEILRRDADPRESDAPWSMLGLALLKGDRFEWALEKAVEVGVHEIWPLLCDHCVVRWKESGGAKKLERWRRIAESAMKQSGRSWRPVVHPPVRPLEAVETFRQRFGSDSLVAVADEAVEDGVPAGEDWAPKRPRLVLVGPEGAFSESEKAALTEARVPAFSLGPYRLRAETAALVALVTTNGGH